MGSVGERSAIPEDSSDEPVLDSSAPSIDLFLPHGHFSPVLSWLFSFLTSSQKKTNVILLNTISSHLNQLCRLVLVLISVVWYNCACVQL